MAKMLELFRKTPVRIATATAAAAGVFALGGCAEGQQVGKVALVDCDNGPRQSSTDIALTKGKNITLGNDGADEQVTLISKGNGRFSLLAGSNRIDAEDSIEVKDNGVTFKTEGKIYTVFASPEDGEKTKFHVNIACE